MKIQTTTIILIASLTGACEFVDDQIYGDEFEEGEIEQSEDEIILLNNKDITRFQNADLIHNSTYRARMLDGLYNSRYDLTWALDQYDSRYFMKAAVECALEPGQSTWFRYYNNGYRYVTYYGQAGFAPEWKDGACDEECQQKVTGCMLSRLNYKGLAVELSLRTYDSTPTPVLERFEHYLAEGAFYGNFFVSGSDKPLYYCSAMTTAHEPELGWSRWCGWSSQYYNYCEGVRYTGPCNDFYSDSRACILETAETSGINGEGTGYYPSAYAYCATGDYAGDGPARENSKWYAWPVSPHRHWSNGY